MMRRLTFLAALAVAASVAPSASAQLAGAAIGFAGYSQTTGPSSITYTRTAAGMGAPLPVTLSATSRVAFTISEPSFLLPAFAGTTEYLDARLTLTAVSNTAAVNVSATERRQEGFSGQFAITDSSGTLNLLSGTFNTAVLGQRRSGTVALETDNVTFSSDIFQPLFNADFILGFSGGFTNLVVNNGAFNNFTANRTSGDFNALVIPEPATLAMAGLGIFALPVAMRVARRRRNARSN